MPGEIKFQIGKSGITPGVIDALLLAFKNHKQARISLLKSSGRDSNSMESIAEEICKGLQAKSGLNYKSKIIGFTIILRKSSSKSA